MRQEKSSMIEEIRSSLAESSFIILVNYNGMKAGQANELRRKLFDENARLRVVKNSILLRAFDDDIRGKIADAVSGPIAMVVGRGDLVLVSKLLKAFCRENELPAVKIGVCKGEILSAADLDLLISLPSKPVLQSMALGLIAAPMARLAGVMRRRLESILYVLSAIKEKKDAGGK